MIGVTNDVKKEHVKFGKLLNILALMGKTLIDGSVSLEQWILFISSGKGKSAPNGHNKINQQYLSSISQALYKDAHKVVLKIQQKQEFNHLLFLLHGIFPAAPTRKYVYQLSGDFIEDKYKIKQPLSVFDVSINILHAYHLLLSWDQLHYATRNFWKIWLEWCWMSNSLAYFLYYVRQCIKLHLIGKCGECKQCNQWRKLFPHLKNDSV